MQSMRTVVLAAGVLAALVGCTSPERNTYPLPPPVLKTRSEPPPVAPIPPPQKRVEAPVRGRGGTPIGSVTIVVDAGHGGHDPGARGLSPVPEKTINLKIANRLAAELERRGAHVIETRSTDRFIALEERAAIAQRSRADLFVSIHADSAPRASASGMTIYVSRGASATSRRAAQHILDALRQAGFECNGIRSAGYRVLIDHTRPAVLIECGYLTNRSDVRHLNDSNFQQALPEAIAEGIAQHFGS